MKESKSYFDGNAVQLFFWKLLGRIITLLTLGICYPQEKCFIERWEKKHTVIDGKRLCFDGTWRELYGKYMLWLLFIILTLGIYYIFVNGKIKRWVATHTHFA